MTQDSRAALRRVRRHRNRLSDVATFVLIGLVAVALILGFVIPAWLP